MASVTGAQRTASPEPMARSRENTLDIRHPTPDLQSLQGAYLSNVERLEHTAERMSSSGSELGEEIRKLQLEQKLADSRRSSLKSLPTETTPNNQDAVPTTRSRNASTSSYGNSIVDVNNTARWGGYSPGGFVTSPIGSLRSGSWSQHSLKRHASASRSSRLDQVLHSDAEEDPAMKPEPLSPVPRLGSPHAHNPRDDASYRHNDYEHGQEMHQDYFTVRPAEHDSHEEVRAAAQPNEHQDQYDRDVQQRPGSAASGDTYHQARTLFHDFDGVHFSPIDEEFEENRRSIIHPPHQSPPQGVPPPRDSMVYYPAPVPRTLNLPKRLSQLPSATVQAKRRTQVLDSIPADNRKSAPWLMSERPASHDGAAPVGPVDSPQLKSAADMKRKTLANLPPQLRASMFFDQQGISQDFDVKGESAADTLDSILEASARAPVGAFTDHPIAGHVGEEVYGRDPTTRRNTVSGLDGLAQDPRKSRSSLNLSTVFARRESAGPGQMNKLQKRKSQMSLSGHLDAAKDEEAPHPNDRDLSHENSPLQAQSPMEGAEESLEEEAAAQHPEQQHYYGPPTTLLAELQMRKQQQRTRNRAAATAFPQGMHATLLELDAVKEIEWKRRKAQRVALAWEDPAVTKAREEEEEEDEDVPLGMLFPGRDGLINNIGRKDQPGRSPQSQWDRPLGLIEKREMEDNEPLSRRRNRLKGVDPNRQPSPSKNLSTPALGTPAQASDAASAEAKSGVGAEAGPEAKKEPEPEDEGETLAQRLRRLRTQKALDGALEDVKTRPVSGGFASELLSQFGGGVDGETKDKADSSALGKTGTPDNEEETLGQRRARLQREAQARAQAGGPGLIPGHAPVLKQSRSMADLLSAHPAGKANQARKISNDALLDSMPVGSLLQRNEMKEAKHKRQLLETNRRSSYFGLDKPLVDVGDLDKEKDKEWDMPLGLIGQANKKKPLGASPGLGGPGAGQMGGGHQMNPSMGNPMAGQMGMGIGNMGGMGMGMTPMSGMQMPMQMMGQNPMMGQQMGMWPQQPQMNMGMQMPMQMQMGMGMNGFGMYQQPAMGMGGMNMGMQMPPMTYAAGAQMQLPMGMNQETMDPRHRDLIDRWRQSIA